MCTGPPDFSLPFRISQLHSNEEGIPWVSVGSEVTPEML